MMTREMKPTGLLCKEISLIRDRNSLEAMKIKAVKRINTIAHEQVVMVESTDFDFEFKQDQKRRIEERRVLAIKGIA